jgi:hypothetical protein
MRTKGIRLFLFLMMPAAVLVPARAQSQAQPGAELPPPAAGFASPPPALVLSTEDLRLEQHSDGGYHVYIRKKPGMASVLLTESTKDPGMKADNYAYRSADWNPVNGDEKRMLDGKFLDPAKKIYSLIDSTPEPDAQLGEAFHVFIPWVVDWGYAWTRNGRTFIHDGTFINIRAFSKPYADYSGSFTDNPYLIRVTQVAKAPPPPEPPKPAPAPPPAPEAPPEPPKEDLSIYIPQTVDSFQEIAKAGEGEAKLVKGPEDIVPAIGRLLDKAKGKSLDLVLCLDTTDSMGDDIDAVRAGLPKLVAEKIGGFSSVRFGLVLYKDYFEEYLVKRYDFTKDSGTFFGRINAVRVGGGRDIPEAVYEALYEALTGFPWEAEAKMVILIGDAPPHPIPRGKIDKAMVEAESAKRVVELDTIILPN